MSPSDAPADSESVDSESNAERIVILGKIGGAFGVQGWVRITSYTDPLENILDYEEWLVGGPGRWRLLEVEDARVTGKGVLAKLAGVGTPEDARQRSGLEIGVRRGNMPQLPPGEYYWSDLEGFEALTKDGEPLGRVDHFRTTPAGALVVIRGAKEHLIPFGQDRLVKVDLEAGRIVFDWDLDW